MTKWAPQFDQRDWNELQKIAELNHINSYQEKYLISINWVFECGGKKKEKRGEMNIDFIEGVVCVCGISPWQTQRFCGTLIFYYAISHLFNDYYKAHSEC